MKMIAAAKNWVAKHWLEDRDHGGWINQDQDWNYWQEGPNRDGMKNEVVYACVRAYAQTIAQLPGLHAKDTKEGGVEFIHNSALARVMRKPNSYQSRSDFLLNLVSALLYNGNAYALATRNARFEIDALHLVYPQDVSAYVTDGEIYYQVAPEAASGLEGAMLVPARDMLHVRLYTPYDPLKGESPITAAALSVAINGEISGHQAAFFKNMSRPSGVISTDEKLTADQTKELRERWESMSKGVNSGKVPILSWGLKWQALSMTSVDAELIESQKMSVERIAGVYGVPLPLVGVLDSATYNNVYNLLSFWKANGLGFVVEHIEQAVTNLFRLQQGEKLELDMNKLMRTDFAGRVDAYTKGITGGLYSPNEARRLEGLKPVEGGEMPRVQQQMVPLDYEEPEPEPVVVPEPVVEVPDPEEERAIALQMIKQAMQ